MSFFIEMLLKLFFLLSIIPFLLSEKLQKKYDMKINAQIEYTLFSGPKKVALVGEKFIEETSGMVVSRKNPSWIYVHNDSGGEPELYIIDTLGTYLGTLKIEGVNNRDWEDLAMGPGPIEGENYLYIGDIGDNFGRAEELIIYRIQEPDQLESEMSAKPEIIKLKYPDGPKDSETLLVDPISGDLFVLTKRESKNTLYKAAKDLLLDGNSVDLEKVLQLPITLSVGGDISADGSQVLIKNYWVIYYWTRKEGETLEETLSGKAVLLPYEPEPQGEAIAFEPEGETYFTLSEKKLRINPVLYRYDKTTGGD
ncbi:MAG: hypothetical protein GYB55_08490 [Cytophagales bacterium]|uniref:hypothetical protein n=1 Tax=Cyclobacterium marinum TaxID=104 RepID=UPI0030DB5ABD|nr:hypothetical protein [Cytophagales bacterium]|tara:strand:- start:72527 stop:73456 length:930 start_codon:yes stop_codon:yes gene_type:complete